MDTILVTGATSFLGRKFVAEISNFDCKVIAVIRKGSNKRDLIQKKENIEIIELNMSEYTELENTCDCIDCFVHFAWEGTRGEDRQNKELQENNYRYSIEAINSVMKVNCKKIVLAGSQAEYGNQFDLITEEMECNPVTEYGKYKLKTYVSAKSICEKNKICLIEPRFFSMYGPDDFEGTLVISCLKNMLKNNPCELTECTQMWDYLYVDDAISAIVKLCTKECNSGVYNIGSGDIRPLREYIAEMKLVVNSESELLFGVKPYPPTGPVNIQPSIQKIKDAVDFEPKVDFSSGIKFVLESL